MVKKKAPPARRGRPPKKENASPWSPTSIAPRPTEEEVASPATDDDTVTAVTDLEALYGFLAAQRWSISRLMECVHGDAAEGAPK